MNKIRLFLSIQYYLFLAKFISAKRSPKEKSVLYLSAFFPGNAGYHWRCEKWAEVLRNSGFEVDIEHALDETDFYALYQSNPTKFLIKFLKKRFWQVVKARNYEKVIVRRELLIFNDYGNLFLEKLLVRIHPNVILDFDDDLAASKNQPKEITSTFGKLCREHGNKFNASLQLYNRFIVASDYLKSIVLRHNNAISDENFCIVPTCVDYDQYPAKDYSSVDLDHLIFGWIGGNYNYPLLEHIVPILNRLAENYNFSMKVIGGTPHDFNAQFKVEFIEWSLQSEVEHLSGIDIGLMPLSSSEIDKGKSGFKLIQYMGLGIVSVASGVTINKEIIDDGNDGFLTYNDSDWETIFEQLLQKKHDLNEVGKKAKMKIESRYTFNANKEKYVTFISN